MQNGIDSHMRIGMKCGGLSLVLLSQSKSQNPMAERGHGGFAKSRIIDYCVLRCAINICQKE